MILLVLSFFLCAWAFIGIPIFIILYEMYKYTKSEKSMYIIILSGGPIVWFVAGVIFLIEHLNEDKKK